MLEATHLLEQDIERLSWAASRAKHAKCQCTYSCSHSRGRPQGRHAQSPSPHRLKKHVTFLGEEEEMSSGEDPSREIWGQATGGGEVEESDLGPPTTLGPDLECFLETPTTMWGTRDWWGSLPEPSINNYKMWLEWWAFQVDTANWWKELVTIPNAGDPERLAKKIMLPSRFHKSDARHSGTTGSILFPMCQNASRGICSCWTPPPTCFIRITG